VASALTPSSSASVAADRATVGRLAEGSASRAANSERMNPWPVKSKSSPSRVGTWPTATVAPTPTWIPTSVGLLMFSTIPPSFSARAASRISPTRKVSVTRSRGISSERATTSALTSVVAVSVAIVEVVDTLMARDPPSSA